LLQLYGQDRESIIYIGFQVVLLFGDFLQIVLQIGQGISNSLECIHVQHLCRVEWFSRGLAKSSGEQPKKGCLLHFFQGSVVEILNYCKGNQSKVDSRRILSHIVLLSYTTTYLQENP